jgi:Ca2+-binding RTX toxin-like protein
VGGPGADTLEGGPGDDLLGDDGNEGDRYVGGDGADRVSYDGAPTRLRIDLATGRGPLGDTYESVEGAIGGPKDDTILGSPGANDLAGGPGRDMMLGRGGPDTIEGGVGEDSVNGNGGDDAIYATEPNGDARERVRCGAGDDLIASHDRDDLLARDCERRQFGRAGNQLTFQPLHIRGTRLDGLALTCSAKAPPAGCSARIVVRIGAGKRTLTLARGTLRAGPGETGAAPLRLIPTFALARGNIRVTIAVRLKARRTYRGSIRTFARNQGVRRRG